jgi:hypothetical protein
MLVLVEDTAEAIASSDVEADQAVPATACTGNGCIGRVFAMP